MSEEHNRLLKRQIRKLLPGGQVPEGMEDFISAVDKSYKEYEASQYLRDRAVSLSSEELKNKNKQLTEKNDLLDSFVYRVSHDLKNPLHNLTSLVQMLKLTMGEIEENSSVDKILSHMDRSTDTMLVRIQDLLELSRMETFLNSKPVLVNLEDELQLILEDQNPAIEQNQASVTFDFSALSEVNFVLENMRSILSNFLSNSIKYRSPDRQPMIAVRTQRFEKEFCLSFSDNGMGIDLEKDGKKLFAMFERLHNHVEGSGVGLFIIKRIVDTAGGRIEVKSSVGVGTTFNIFFPNSLISEEKVSYQELG